jgi:MFS family permease
MLFEPSLRRRTILMWFMWLLTTFLYYGAAIMSTEIFIIEAEGLRCAVHDGMRDGGASDTPASSMIAPSTDDSSSCTIDTSIFSSTLITACGELVFMGVGILLVDRIGRRWTMAVHFSLTAVCLLAMLPCTSTTVETLIMMGARGNAASAFTVLYMYVPEAYPTTVRSVALGTCNTAARIGAVATPAIAQALLRSNFVLAMSVYVVAAVLCTVTVLMLRYEPAGKELVEASIELDELTTDDLEAVETIDSIHEEGEEELDVIDLDSDPDELLMSK